MNVARLSRQKLDAWFPTFVRYCGVGLTVVLVVGTVLGKNDYPAAYVAAAGMILYKTVAGAAATADSLEEERWSHLP